MLCLHAFLVALIMFQTKTWSAYRVQHLTSYCGKLITQRKYKASIQIQYAAWGYNFIAYVEVLNNLIRILDHICLHPVLLFVVAYLWFFFLFICSCTQQISGVKEPHQRWCSPSWGSSRVKDSSRQTCKNDREGSRTHALIRWFEFKQVYRLREDVRVSIASRFTQLIYLFTIQMSLLSLQGFTWPF